MAFSGSGTATGALGGAASGAMIGSVVPGIGTAVGAGVGGLIGGLGGSGLFGGGSSTGSGLPQFSPQQALQLEQQQYNQMAPQAQQFGTNVYNQAQQNALNLGQQFAQQGTKQQIALQNLVTPGSSAQRELANRQLNSYIQGQIPLDVQQQINREVAQNLGGGFNLFTGGGQAPQNFARNLGQTSLGLSQYGLSAAPTWQQLANQMVVSPTVGFQAGMQGTLQATGLGSQLAASAAGLGNQLAESQYQGGFNQYQANQLQNQQQAQLGLQLGQLGLEGANALNKASYLQSLSPSAQGYQNTMGGLPAATGYGAYNQPGGGFYQQGTNVMVPAFGQ